MANVAQATHVSPETSRGEEKAVKEETTTKETSRAGSGATEKVVSKPEQKPRLRNERTRRPRRAPRRQERREFDQKIISIRRVTRVVAGGRRFSFSVAIVIGDGKGKVA